MTLFSRHMIAAVLCFGSLVAPVRAEAPLKVTAIESPDLAKDEMKSLAQSLGIEVGRNFDAQRVDQGIQNIYSRGRYEMIAVDSVASGQGAIKVILRATRFRKIHAIEITGVDEETMDEIRGRVDVSDPKSLDRKTLEILRGRLKELLENRGYYNSSVELKWTVIPSAKKTDAAEQVNLIVAVNTGEITRIKRAIVMGGSEEDNATIQALLTLRPGEPFSRKALEDNVSRINKYFEENQYPTSKVDETELSFSPDRTTVSVSVLIRVQDKYVFQFKGNTVFEEVTLRDLMTPELLSQGDSASRVAALLQAKYKSVGYHFCRVKVDSSSASDRKVTTIRFDIEEGEKVLIDRIEFSGGLGKMPKERIVKLFYEGAPGVLNRGVFWDEGLGPAVKELQNRLNQLGYLSVSLTSPRIVFSADKKGAELFFDIELGDQTIVGAVKTEGITHLKPTQVQDLIAIQEGDAFSPEAVQEARRRLIGQYQSLGYVDMKFADEGQKDAGIQLSKDHKTAAITFSVVEGGQYHVGKVSLEGNRKTQEKVIMREMTLKTGDIFDPGQARKAEDDIATLGLFSRVEIIPSNDEHTPLLKNLKIVVRENQPGVGEVGFGGYYEDPRLRLRTFLGMAYRNLWGLNQTASGRAQLALPISRQKSLVPFIEYAGQLAYRAPYPFEIPLIFTTQFIFESFELAQLESQDIRIQTSTKIEARVEKKFTPWFTGIYRLYQLERTVTETLDIPSTKKIDIIGSTGPGAIFDFRDDIYNPSKGSLHTLNLELASPLLLSNDTISFYMATSRNSFYVPLPAGMQLSLSASFGYAESLFSGLPVPEARLANQLSLGGRQSIRGFNVGLFSPVAAPGDPAIERTAFYNGRAELAIPIVGNYKVAFFYDTGQIFPNLRPQPREDGVGLGLRYKIPVGPIVVDFARGLGPRGEFKFYFTIGTL